jgi:S1-C subfamily serine protease
MKTFLSVVLFFSGIATAAGQVRGNVLSRVYQIRYAGYTGTSFIIDYSGAQYFVTAEHMVKDAGPTASVDILDSHGVWFPIKFTILHGSYPCSDVAVLVPSDLGTKFMTNEDTPPLGGWIVSQEVYFLGFPYGLFNSGVDEQKQRIVVPLVKHGYLSASLTCDAVYPKGSAEKRLLLLDGINNHGFSGGPVIGPNLSLPDHPMGLLGIVSGYKNDPTPINVNGVEAPNVSAAANSGIIIVTPIFEAIDLIKAFLKTNVAKPTLGKQK